MKSFLTALGLLAATAAGYPQALSAADMSAYTQLSKQVSDAASAMGSGSGQRTAATFSAPLQKIDVGGLHAWRAPGPGDERGPCPGLNVSTSLITKHSACSEHVLIPLANHGYLPRNGFASILDFVGATTTVFGMGPVLAVVLSLYGAAINGVVLGWSIGYEGPVGRGIGGSRGNYETDNSPMRGDLYQYGSNTDLVLSQFERFYDLQPDDATANYNIDVLNQFRAMRFQESIEKNPYFYYGPFSGTTVSIAAYSFIYRFFANHTAEAPDGVLNGDVLKSFMSITGTKGNFTWTPGHERIPENWYRRSLTDPCELTSVAADGGLFGETTPQSTKPDCNTGTVNSYQAIDTGYQDYDFSKPTAGACFAVNTIFGVTSLVPVVGDVVNMLIIPVQNALECANVPGRNDTVGDVCPGYSFYAGPTAPIAPGAIQN